MRHLGAMVTTRRCHHGLKLVISKSWFFWLALRCQHVADGRPDDPWWFSIIKRRYEKKPTTKKKCFLLNSSSVSCPLLVFFVWSEDNTMQVLATSAFSLQRAICILDSAGIVLGEMDAEEASKMLLLHCKSYCWLSAFFSQRKMLFRVRPKLHYIMHQALQVKHLKLNLSSFTTFEEESFLGKIKAIICSCHGATCYVRFFQRYLLCLALMIRKHHHLEASVDGAQVLWCILSVLVLGSSGVLLATTISFKHIIGKGFVWFFGPQTAGGFWVSVAWRVSTKPTLPGTNSASSCRPKNHHCGSATEVAIVWMMLEL